MKNEIETNELTKIDYEQVIKIISKMKSFLRMKINGFLFFMKDCYQISTDTVLIIYDKESDRKITYICIKEINSLIDDEVLL